MLELVVAMTLLGFALAGLFPLLAKYSQQVQRLEKCSPQCGRWKQNPDKTWTFPSTDPTDPTYDTAKLPSALENRYSYPNRWNLVPADDPWMWKLGAAASLVPDMPTHTPYLRPFPYTAPTPTPTPLPADDDDDLNDAPYKEDETDWIAGPDTGYEGDSRRHASGTPDVPAATWTFTNVQPGWYDIEAFWPDPAVGTYPGTDVVATNAAVYRLLDGANSPILDKTGTAIHGSADQTTNWGSWNCIMTAYIPKRVVVADPNVNFLTTIDANGHSVKIYNGDTVKVQIQVPASPGFITADGMRLVAKKPNKIVRFTPLKRTWSYDPNGNTDIKTVEATVTVTAQ